jgi:hypothetical protein
MDDFARLTTTGKKPARFSQAINAGRRSEVRVRPPVMHKGNSDLHQIAST